MVLHQCEPLYWNGWPGRQEESGACSLLGLNLKAFATVSCKILIGRLIEHGLEEHTTRGLKTA